MPLKRAAQEVQSKGRAVELQTGTNLPHLCYQRDRDRPCGFAGLGGRGSLITVGSDIHRGDPRHTINVARPR